MRLDSGGGQTLNDRRAGTIHAGQFRLVDPDFAVVDLQTGQSGQNMLDHLNLLTTTDKRRATRRFHSVPDRGVDARCPGHISAEKDDSRVDASRSKLDRHVQTGPVPESDDSGGSGDRTLGTGYVNHETQEPKKGSPIGNTLQSVMARRRNRP